MEVDSEIQIEKHFTIKIRQLGLRILRSDIDSEVLPEGPSPKTPSNGFAAATLERTSGTFSQRPCCVDESLQCELVYAPL